MLPFFSWTVATLAHSEMPLSPVALVLALPLLSTLKRFLLWHIGVGHLHRLQIGGVHIQPKTCREIGG